MKKILLILVAAFMLVMVGCGSKPTLAEYLESDVVVAGVEETNSELADAGLRIRVKYSADGEDIFVLSYIYEDYQSLYGLDQSEIDAKYAEELDHLGTYIFAPHIFKACKDDLDLTLRYIRAQCVNPDGTVIYSQDFYDVK